MKYRHRHRHGIDCDVEKCNYPFSVGIDDDYLYAITYAQNLRGIREHGLTPQGGVGISEGGWEAHAAGAVHLTEYGDPGYFGRTDIEFWQDHYRDTHPRWPIAVLRVRREVLDPSLLQEESVTPDALPVWRYAGTIPPEKLEVREGRSWRAL